MEHVLVFIKAKQVPLLAARDRKRAVAKHPLGIDQMADDFANAPLAIRVAKGFVLWRNLVEQNIERVELRT